MCEATSKQEKFTELYMKYRNYLFAICNHVLHNEHDSEDALQEAFLKIYNNLDKLEHECVNSSRTKSLVTTITRNTAIDFYRKKQKKTSTEMTLEDYYAFDLGQGKSGLESEDEELFATIGKLPLKYSECILLKYASGFSNQEIAEILDISESNVRMRISRGKKKLFSLLEEEGKDW